ncbi:MAG: thiamine pyrophosphate-binding protein [Pseudomonadota bacterium]|nr:thiamine pyrophosphate-binding protein [Pseudomonadota bacterium]
MAMMTAAQAVVEALRAEGVRNVFGLPGGHIIGILDALYHAPDISFYRVRHEHAAAHMAFAYAQLTGEPGVVLVTAGAGATNLVTGVAEAFVGAQPMIVLAGRAPSATAHRGESQEVATDRIFAPITKFAARVDRIEALPDLLSQAFLIARSGRPGPVYLDLPVDLLGREIADDYRPAPRPGRPRPAAGDVAEAARLLASARRPLIVAGGGALASEAGAEIVALAERLAAPVLVSLSGRSVLDDDHPLAAGGLGTHGSPVSQVLLNEADVILNLGCRFESMSTNWRPEFSPAPEASHLQVNIDPAEIGRSFPASLGLVADVRESAREIDAALAALGVARDWRREPRTLALREKLDALEAETRAIAARDDKPLHSVRIIRAAQEAFSREAIYGVDIGCLAEQLPGSPTFLKLHGARTLLAPSSLYGMSDAAAGLPAARIVHPGRPAVGFVGDGSFQMMFDVLPFAAEYRLGVTWCILNDEALGSIWDLQNGRMQGRFIGTQFALQPDFAALARACGCCGERVVEPADIAPALQRARDANAAGQPAVIDFAVARVRAPQTVKFFGIADPRF